MEYELMACGHNALQMRQIVECWECHLNISSENEKLKNRLLEAQELIDGQWPDGESPIELKAQLAEAKDALTVEINRKIDGEVHDLERWVKRAEKAEQELEAARNEIKRLDDLLRRKVESFNYWKERAEAGERKLRGDDKTWINQVHDKILDNGGYLNEAGTPADLALCMAKALRAVWENKQEK